MNNLLYKKKLVEKKFSQREEFSLIRDNTYFQKYYEIKIKVKYGQSKFYASKNDIKNLAKGSYVEGKGLFEGVTIIKIEQNYFTLSRPVLSYGEVTLSFKCKLSLGDSWLDWTNTEWKNKINDSKSKYNFEEYKNQDSYFLRVKNHYESRCLYPIQDYYVREPETIDVFDYIYCGQSVVETSNLETVNCGENAKYLGQVSCGETYNQLDVLGELACSEQELFVGQKACGETHDAKK